MGLEQRYDPGEGFYSQSAKQVSLPLSDLLLIAILPTLGTYLKALSLLYLNPG